MNRIWFDPFDDPFDGAGDVFAALNCVSDPCGVLNIAAATLRTKETNFVTDHANFSNGDNTTPEQIATAIKQVQDKKKKLKC
jgi:hypothetical protein